MTLFVNWENDENAADQPLWESRFQEAVQAVLREEGLLDLPVEVSLSVVGREEIHRLNREFRQVDRPTDVLSFPLLDFQSGPVRDAVENGEVNPESREVCLGDIVICQEIAEEQAREYEHSLLREMSFLTIHSMLHLLGYDHMEPEEEAEMCRKQEMILQSLGIGRE